MKFSQIFLAIYVFALVVFSASPETVFLENLLGALLVGVFLVETAFVYGPKLKWHYSINYILAFAIFVFLGMIFTDFSVQRMYLTFVLVLGLFFTVFNIIRRDKKITGLKYGLMVGVLYNVAFSLDDILLLAIDAASGRLAGSIGNANAFAFLMIMLVLILLKPFFVKNYHERQELNKYLKAFNFLLIIACSFLIVKITGSRKGVVLLGLIFMGTYYFNVREHSFIKKAFASLTFGVCILAFSLWFQDTSAFTRLENAVLFFQGESVNEGSIGTRAGMAEVGFNLWSQYPLFGWGFDSFREVSGFNTYSHSNFIELLSNNGLIGFSLYYSFILSILYTSYKTYQSKDFDKGLLNWSILIIVVLLAWDVAAVSYYSKSNWIMYGAALANILNAKKEP